MDVLLVVIADDDELMRESLADLLDTADGLRLAGVARDADEAVERCRQHRPDVAVLDLHMPGGGPAGAAGIREVSPTTRLVGLSSDGSDEARRQMHEAGVADFVVKGSSVHELLAVIRGSHDQASSDH